LLYQIPEALIRAVIKAESGFRVHAVSWAGARGLMQLMPQTASKIGVKDSFDPRENILGGTRYLRLLANTFGGNLILTLAGYHAGQNAVIKYGGVPPYPRTRLYIKTVLKYYYQYQAKEKK
jgi:soluble lytic murein transglycosylase-like protein